MGMSYWDDILEGYWRGTNEIRLACYTTFKEIAAVAPLVILGCHAYGDHEEDDYMTCSTSLFTSYDALRFLRCKFGLEMCERCAGGDDY